MSVCEEGSQCGHLREQEEATTDDESRDGCSHDSEDYDRPNVLEEVSLYRHKQSPE